MARKGGPNTHGERAKLVAEGERVLARERRPKPLPEVAHHLPLGERKMRWALTYLHHALQQAEAASDPAAAAENGAFKVRCELTADLRRLVKRWMRYVAFLRGS